ncbi:hypothetical protein ACGFZS_48175 [Streptomyces sp. NPDC048288]|uniref:RICIN domain-containing protein n=1 Tax=Streptomyces sp. NPDC048288 TaxID=3365529 RepID=UPI00371D49CB
MGPNFIRNWNYGVCLDSNAAGDLYTNPCQEGNNYQKWVIVYDSHVNYGQVKIYNVATGRYLWWAQTTPFTQVYFPSTDPYYQQQIWEAVGSSWDKFQLKDPDWSYGAHWCLYADGNGDAHATGCNPNGTNLWKFGY